MNPRRTVIPVFRDCNPQGKGTNGTRKNKKTQAMTTFTLKQLRTMPNLDSQKYRNKHKPIPKMCVVKRGGGMAGNNGLKEVARTQNNGQKIKS